MRHTDVCVFFLYLGAVLALGFVLSGRNRSPHSFVLADRSLGWVAVGISVVVSVFSATNFTAFSSEVFQHGLRVVAALAAFLPLAFVVTRFVIPFYLARKRMSAYEFLEERFGPGVRRLAAGLFITWRLMWMTLALYAASSFIASLLRTESDSNSLRIGVTVFVGGLAALYTAGGGMKTVVLMDTAQFCVIAGSLAAGVAAVAAGPGGFRTVFESALAGGRLKPFFPPDASFLSWDPTVRITLWSAIIGSFVAFLDRYAADQMVVQRFYSSKSAAHATAGFLFNVACYVPILLCLMLIGLAVYSRSASLGLLANPAMRPMDHLAAFIASLPSGVCGLAASGIVASVMTSVDSGIHACATSISLDLGRKKTESADVRQMRKLALAVGAIVILAACCVGRLGTVFEIANKIVNGLGSPLLAICLMGMLVRSCSPRGMLLGGITGTALSCWVSLRVTDLALHYYAVVNLLGTMALCCVFSLPGAIARRSARPAGSQNSTS